MIKRRFYRLEHGERDSGSDSSSFSSDSEVETEESEDDIATNSSEDVSASEHDEEDEVTGGESLADAADVHSDDDIPNENDNADSEIDADSENDEHKGSLQKTKLPSRHGLEVQDAKFDTINENELVPDFPAMIKCKSVFKCRYCPNIVCLNEGTMRAHVMSKKHARAERLLKQGKSKAIDSDGEVDNQGNTEGTDDEDMSSVQEKKRKGNKKPRRQRKKLRRQGKGSTKNGENIAVMPEKPIKRRRQSKD